ncbi:hypothetical protein ACWY4P_53800 (plasmid) [Streptomyces sp. LZ34]
MNAQIRNFPNQAEEALRRARAVDAAKQLSANGLRMAQRVQSRALSDAIQALVVAALPLIDNDSTAPMAQLQIHTPFGELIGSYDLPEQIADTLIVAAQSLARSMADDNAEHTRTADTAPARPALSVLTGGAR